MNRQPPTWIKRQADPFGRRSFGTFALLSSVLLSALAARALAQSAAQLQPLLNDTVAQLRLSYRQNLPEQRRRYEAVAHVISVWRAADRMAENDRRLEEWLRGAIRSSMPGSGSPLPPMPTFANRPEPPPAEAPAAAGPERTRLAPDSIGELPLPSSSPPPAPLRPELPSGEQLPFEEPSQSMTVEKPAIPPTVLPADPESVTSHKPLAEDSDAASTTDDDLFETASENDPLPEEPVVNDELPAEPALDEDPDILKALGDPFVDDPAPL